MPNNSARAVIQSRDGYVWVATDGGLTRFDGVRFTDIERKAGEKRSRWLFGLAEAHDGSIWSSSVNGGVIRYRQGQITRFTTNDGLPNDLVLTISQDSRSNLWLGTSSGLCRWSEAEGRFIAYTNQPGVIVEAVRSVLEDRQHNLWIGTAVGLSCLRPNGTAVAYTTNDFLVNNAVLCLREDRHGGLWIGTSGGLTYWQNGSAKQFTSATGLLHDAVRAVIEDCSGNIWVGTQGGVQQVTNGELRSVSLNNPTDPDLEGITYVYSMCEDREGNIWVGSSVGLNQLRKQSFVTLTKEQGLPANEATCVFEDNARNLWIGTYGGGLCRIRDDTIEVLSKNNGLVDDHVLSIWQDHEGSIWIGTDGYGVQRLKDGKFTSFNFSDNKANVVRVIYEDARQNLWLGSNLGTARLAGKKFERKTALSQNTMKAIGCDAAGRVWFAGESAFFRISHDSPKVVFSRSEFGQTSGNAICPDTDGCWIGTDEGLYFVDNDQVRNFAKSPALGRDAILHIVKDNAGRLWMSGRHAVFIAPADDLVAFARGQRNDFPLVQVGKMDGLRRVQANGNGQPSGWKLSDGRICFPTVHGVLIFDPASVDTSDAPPEVRIEDITVNDKTYLPGPNLALDPASGHVRIRYTALHFRSPERVNFKFKVEGFDPDWIDAGTRRLASYRLGSGTHRFLVTACSRTGLWNPQPAQITFTIKPQFHETFWFYGCCTLIAAGGATVLYRVRQLQAKNRERELMRLVELHTAKYRNAAQSMESFNYSIAHDLRAPLRAIRGLTEALSEDYSPSMDPIALDYMNRIVFAVGRMDAMITDLLTYGHLTHTDFKMTAIDVEDVLSQVRNALEPQICVRHANICITKPLGRICGNETLLFQVLNNLLSNALKFIPQGSKPEIHIWAETVGIRKKIYVRDNGIGIDPRFHQKIFGMFERLHTPTEYPGTGIGLAIVHKAVQQMGGTLGVVSSVGQGSCFWFELPAVGVLNQDEAAPTKDS